MEKSLLNKMNEYEDIFDGATVFDTPDFYDAAIGMTEEGRIIYDYEKMPECLMKEPHNMSYEEAVEWIDYNTIRTIPYMGDKAPIIMHKLPWNE